MAGTPLPNLPASGAEHQGLVTLLIVSAFIVAGGIHYQTPMLAAIAAEFNADAATVGWIPTLSFGGMMAGILLFVPLGDRIEVRRRFIEHQDRCVLEERARDRDALALATRELNAALAHARLNAFGKTRDEFG